MLRDNTSYRELNSIQRDLTRPKYTLLFFFTNFYYLSLCAHDCSCLWKHRRALGHLDLLLEVNVNCTALY